MNNWTLHVQWWPSLINMMFASKQMERDVLARGVGREKCASSFNNGDVLWGMHLRLGSFFSCSLEFFFFFLHPSPPAAVLSFIKVCEIWFSEVPETKKVFQVCLTRIIILFFQMSRRIRTPCASQPFPSAWPPSPSWSLTRMAACPSATTWCSTRRLARRTGGTSSRTASRVSDVYVHLMPGFYSVTENDCNILLTRGQLFRRCSFCEGG